MDEMNQKTPEMREASSDVSDMDISADDIVNRILEECNYNVPPNSPQAFAIARVRGGRKVNWKELYKYRSGDAEKKRIDKNRLKELWDKGLTIRMIADEMGIPCGTLKSFIRVERTKHPDFLQRRKGGRPTGWKRGVDFDVGSGKGS